MTLRLRNLTFLHVLLIVMAVGALVRVAELGTAIAETAPEKVEKIEPKEDKDEKEKESGKKNAETKDDKNNKSKDDKTVVIDEAEPDEQALQTMDENVLQQLSQRRKQLDQREKQLEQRDALLKAARVELERKFKELDAVRAEIKTLLGQQSEAEEAKLKSLVKVYEGMKPTEAATILNTLETDVLLQVMDRMSERKMSPILAKMDPDVARAVTIRLAKQRTLPEAGVDASPAATLDDNGTDVPLPPKI